MTEAPAIDLETLHSHEDLATTPFSFGSVTNTIPQRTWEQSHPPSHQERGMQTLTLAVDPEVPHELAPGPFTMGLRIPREYHG